MLLRQIKRDGRLPTKKRNTLSAILFIPAIIIFALIFKQISGWRADIEAQNKRAEIYNFASSVYPKLVTSQKAILDERNKMLLLLQKVQNLGIEHPNHIVLIDEIIKQWREGLGKLISAYKKTDRQIRLGWVSYKNGDKKHVRSEFDKKAVRLYLGNQAAEKKYRSTIYNIQDKLIKSMDDARSLLKANRIPPSKKQKTRVQKIRESIIPFNDKTVEKLIIFTGEKIDTQQKGKREEQLKEKIEGLQNIIRHAAQQSILLKNDLRNNPDLEAPLKITINRWNLLERTSQEKLNEILFAIEAEYIARILKLPRHDNAIRAMHSSLKKEISYIVDQAFKSHKSIEQSYSGSSRKRDRG